MSRILVWLDACSSVSDATAHAGALSRPQNFTHEDKVRVGLVAKPGGLLSSSLSWLGLAGGEEEGGESGTAAGGAAGGGGGKSITDLWVEFLVSEAESAAASAGERDSKAAAGAGSGDASSSGRPTPGSGEGEA